MPVYLLPDELIFPSPQLARKEGLLAVGGDLSQERLLLAYRMGIFPWYSEDEPIMWWSPDPRLVLYPSEFRVSRSLKKTIRKQPFKLTVDEAFESVINACAHSRTTADEGTWIVEEMIAAYCRLHESGLAHSVEVWQDGE
jgi:leucyl/phenylalanyl-tRNA--protein transferase